ncbi:MAG: DUF523 domain-containing protein [Bryobacteraceae bacterium]|jgi:uncharacterized protein YbbK (DUF523 family)
MLPLFDPPCQSPTRTVVASACRCGERCLWNGERRAKSTVIRRLEADGVRVVPVCPEMLGGLPCPRPPVKSKRGRVFETDPETRKTFGAERTEEFTRGAETAVSIALGMGATEAYLQRFSPSCSPTGIAGRAFAAAGIKVVPIW